MKRARITARIFTIFALCLIAMGLSYTSSTPVFWDGAPDGNLVSAITAAMTDEELLGQVFFLGYHGTQPSQEILLFIRNRNLGGLKVFTRNVSSLPQITSDIRTMQEASQTTRFKIPMFVATDQEGGWVTHIRKGSSISGGNLSLGAGGVPHDAFLSGYYIGCELAAMGVNMNYAPNLDIYTNPRADAVGPRGFSQDPVQVGIFGAAYLQGMMKAGIIATGKHFPGHGDADKDSHGYLPEIQIDSGTLYERELFPYRMAIHEGLPAIMSAHIAFPSITGNRVPATLSKYFLVDVLREKLGFTGIVLTDDMEMNGVLMSGDSVAQACKKAMLAGNDMVLISHTPAEQEAAWQLLLRAMHTDREFHERVAASAARILALKLKTFRHDPANPDAPVFSFLPDPGAVEQKIPAPQAPDFFFQSLCRGITVIRDGRIPYKPAPGERVLIAAHYADFLNEGKKRYPSADSLYIPWSSRYEAIGEEISLVTGRVPAYDTVIFCLSSESSLDILLRLSASGKKIIVISALTPVYLRETPWVQTAIAVFGESRDAFMAGFSVLAGDFTPEGKLPVDFIKP
ncbi:MAG: glycoside hydrolase family 3 protein [Spirochaetaceae bacterium]|nr:MAG: glycoside hydrolase family 3 protein [Spirochaetaceae bacterium]